MQEGKSVRLVLAGGVDPGTGAGVARDLLTASALGARAIVVGTAWTEQGQVIGAREGRRALPDGPHRGRSKEPSQGSFLGAREGRRALPDGPHRGRLKEPSQGSFFVEPREPERVRVALTAALAKVGAIGTGVKIGMVATAAIAQAVQAALASYGGPVVYDPVLRASSGGLLYDGDRESILSLARRATLLTPNLDEATWLLERPVRTQAEGRDAARALRGLGIAAVLVKGGHLEGEATDVLLSPAGESWFSSPRVAGPGARGTGCALATAIAVELAAGEPLERAVAAAKTWLTEQIARASAVGDERHL